MILLCYYSVSSLIAIKIPFLFFFFSFLFILGGILSSCWVFIVGGKVTFSFLFYEKIFWEIHSLLITKIQHITYSHPKFILLRNNNMYLYNDHLFFIDMINCLLSSGMFNNNCCSSIVFSSHLSVKRTLKKKKKWEYRHYPSPTTLTYPCFVLYISVNFKLGQVGTSIH